MANLGDLFQNADWKKEKHAPAIELPEVARKGEAAKITIAVGKEISHPNTTEHHISWIAVYFKPQDEKFPYQVGKFEFTAHGASARGPDTGGVYTLPLVTVMLKVEKPGMIYAASYCNIHGLWESSSELNVE